VATAPRKTQPDKSRNPGARAGLWITVDRYLLIREVTIHNHQTSRAARISSHVSPSR